MNKNEVKGLNQSGILPTGGHLLVKPDKVKEITEGGIYLPQDTQEKEQLAATSGILVAVGDTAWADIDGGDLWATVGDHISYSRYAGVTMDGQDGEQYVLINDVDILARLLF